MVGDRWRDIEAGRRAGCRTIFIDYAYHETRPALADHCVKSLLEATEFMVERMQVKMLEDLKVKIFADGADKAGMLEMDAQALIRASRPIPR